MKKNKKLFLGTLLGLGLGGIILFGLSISQNRSQTISENAHVLGESTKADLSSAVKTKSLADLDALVEIPNAEDAIVVEVTDQKKIREFDPLFGRTYLNDLVVFLPDQTIVYDPTTKTVRDIISKSFYKEVQNAQ